MNEINFDVVAHVGEMDWAKKNSGSYHGAGLAVSRHPEAWGRIARIGTAGFILRPVSGSFRFLDRRGMSDQERADVTDWSMAEAYLSKVSRFRVSFTDTEIGEKRYVLFTSEADAMAELEEAEEASLEVVETLEATSRLVESTDQVASWRSKITGSLAFDLALTCYAEQLSDFDGVWWSDKFNPLAYSAPYGTLLRIGSCETAPYDFSDFVDWEEFEDSDA